MTYFNSSIMTSQILLLELSSGFNTINVYLLIYRLTRIGIENTVSLWISKYITNITYINKINKSLSSKRRVLFVIPQGSSLYTILCLPTHLSKLIKTFSSADGSST